MIGSPEAADAATLLLLYGPIWDVERNKLRSYVASIDDCAFRVIKVFSGPPIGYFGSSTELLWRERRWFPRHMYHFFFLLLYNECLVLQGGWELVRLASLRFFPRLFSASGQRQDLKMQVKNCTKKGALRKRLQ